MTAPGGTTTPDDPLTAAVRALVGEAVRRAVDDRSRTQLTEAGARLSQPLRLALAGRVKAGKSTLLNALVGEELAPTDAGECTKVVTWYVGGDVPRVTAHGRDGSVRVRPYSRASGALDVDLGVPAEDVDHLEVQWPSSRLRDVTLIDTPGIASLSTEVSDRAGVVLSDDDERPSIADAVLYLLRHAHGSDLRFLEAFADDDLARGTPVNAVGVLSRADEIGACRMDALDVAARVAARYESDPRVRRLCPLVIPVAGLLGQSGTTLREEEYRGLARLAALPPDVTERLLLTADRFVVDDTSVPVTAIEREHLVDRLGLFGVRLGVELVRDGEAVSATDLARQLTRRSGLDDVRDVLLRQFTDRSRLLRSRSALAAVRAVVRRGGCADPQYLEAAAEEVSASAHEFVEVRLLNQLRSGTPAVPDDLVTPMDRLLGGSGHDLAVRLGQPAGTPAGELRTAAMEQLATWHQVAESPLSSRSVQLAARGVIRTLEGLLVALSTPDPAASAGG
jgi:Dynamin family